MATFVVVVVVVCVTAAGALAVGSVSTGCVAAGALAGTGRSLPEAVVFLSSEDEQPMRRVVKPIRAKVLNDFMGPTIDTSAPGTKARNAIAGCGRFVSSAV